MNISKLKSLTPHFGKGPRGLFTYKELERLLNLRPFVNNLRFKPTGGKKYHWPVYDWFTDKDSWPISCIKDALSKTSAYISDASRANEKINKFSETLEKIFKRPTDCHIYFSLNKNVESFGRHRDQSHNVIVVCEGKINFKIYDGDTILEKNLSKGDYAFIPVNVDHHLTPLTSKRLSCSFPIAPDGEKFDERDWFKIT